MKRLTNNSTNTWFSLIFLFIACANSCIREYPVHLDSEEKELFFYSNKEGLYVNGNVLFTVNDSLHQRAYNIRRKQYRIQSDVQDTYLNIFFEKKPRFTGTKLNAEIDFRSFDNIITIAGAMECSKISEGKYWIWDANTKTGVILRLK